MSGYMSMQNFEVLQNKMGGGGSYPAYSEPAGHVVIFQPAGPVILSSCRPCWNVKSGDGYMWLYICISEAGARYPEARVYK